MDSSGIAIVLRRGGSATREIRGALVHRLVGQQRRLVLLRELAALKMLLRLHRDAALVQPASLDDALLTTPNPRKRNQGSSKNVLARREEFTIPPRNTDVQFYFGGSPATTQPSEEGVDSGHIMEIGCFFSFSGHTRILEPTKPHFFPVELVSVELVVY